MRRAALCLVLLAACGSVDEKRHLDGGTDGMTVDAPPDARVPTCWGATFSAPQPIQSLNSTNRDAFLRLSSDELVAYFSRDVVGATAVLRGHTASRSSSTGAFGSTSIITITGDTATEMWSPTVTADGRTLYFTRANGQTKDIYKATRTATGPTDPFSGLAPVTELNSTSSEEDVYVVPDGSAIYFSTDRANNGTFSIFRAAANGASFSPPVEVLADTSLFVNRVVISPDELTMFYQGGNEIHETRRASKTSAWTLSPAITMLGSTSADHPTWVSSDGCRVYLQSDRMPTAGAMDLYVAVRTAQ